MNKKHEETIFQILDLPEELQNVTSDDVTVWVDPLDGTAEYTQGLLDHVTVLIGIYLVDSQMDTVYFKFKQIYNDWHSKILTLLYWL